MVFIAGLSKLNIVPVTNKVMISSTDTNNIVHIRTLLCEFLKQKNTKRGDGFDRLLKDK
jgi:hypothetical protein